MSDSRSLPRISKIPSTGSPQPRSTSRSAALRSGQLARTGRAPLAVRQSVEKREPVDGVDRLVLISTSDRRLRHKPLQMPFHPRAEREADQGPLQLRAAFDEAGKRPLVAACLMARGATSLLSPAKRVTDSAHDTCRAIRAAREAAPGSRHVLSGPYCPPLRSDTGQLESGCELSRSAVFTLRAEPALLLRRRPDASSYADCLYDQGNHPYLGTETPMVESAGISGCSKRGAASSLITTGQKDTDTLGYVTTTSLSATWKSQQQHSCSQRFPA